MTSQALPPCYLQNTPTPFARSDYYEPVEMSFTNSQREKSLNYWGLKVFQEAPFLILNLNKQHPFLYSSTTSLEGIIFIKFDVGALRRELRGF